ncbi:hypothetical protein J3R83DRAFT_3545 [Lanmaoa asiatica]|nr:hypothetical protein J3R83DRAFT_3545 [Lanmaoa asiatica]
MQDPKKEITNIIHTLCTTRDAKELEETVMKLTSPETQVHSKRHYELNVLVVEVIEKLNVWFIPLPSKAGRMIVRLQLRKMNGSHYVMVEEDLAHLWINLGSLPLLSCPLQQSLSGSAAFSRTWARVYSGLSG